MTKLRDPVNAEKIKRGYTIMKDINGIIFWRERENVTGMLNVFTMNWMNGNAECVKHESLDFLN